ncbi:MAG: hypothetical protein JWN04_2911 [Myxococcaceae bacterium]|nr:hypothetical protein [Myxococcaceae bacterium]
MVNESAHTKPCEIILGAARRTPRKVGLLAGVAAALLHVGGAAAAVALGGTHEQPASKKSQPLVVIDHVIDLDPPKLAEPEPPAPPAPPQEDRAPPPRSKPRTAPVAKAAEPPAAEQAPPAAPEPVKPASEPPPAAQAAQVVAALPAAEAPPAFAIATGTGQAYAGGTTSASGTGAKANHTGQVGVGEGSGLSRARAPQLHSRSWPCGWPTEADDLDLDEAFVTVRASIGADGSVLDVEVVSDPGHGFGKRAALCARTKVRFDPALDAAGNPTGGKTPLLRIRFVRDEE